MTVIFPTPNNSPWGIVDYYDTLCPGVFLVYTPDQGGTMVAKEVEDFISSAALRYGQRSNGFICFEQDTDEDIVLRELLDKKLWDIPDRVRDRAAFEERINNALREHHPEYWRVWENRRKYAPTIKISPGHNER